jgi:3-hydroxyisobutyrate dehydrogenase-like beta-hydroxyacid dehydrogenase
MIIEHIGVVGLGQMGAPIAAFLLKADYKVCGFDIVPEKAEALAPLGLTPARSPKESAAGAELVILSLRNWAEVASVAEGEGGILEGAQAGLIIADCSTVPPAKSRAMAGRLAERGIHWMDVPVSGAANQAREGNMVFMVGGERTIFEAIKPVFDQVGKKTVYVGKSGDAVMLKTVVNHVLFLNQAAAIEGLVLGKKAGLDPEILLDVLVSGAAGSDLLAARGRDMLAGDFSAKGALWIAAKDLALSLQSAGELGVALPMGGLYQQLLAGAQSRGWDQEDATVVMRLYEELAGIGADRPSATAPPGEDGAPDASD